MKRRSLLTAASGALMTLIGAALAVPAAMFVGFPTRRRTVSGAEDPIDVAALGALPEGQPVRMAIRARRLRDAWNAFTDVTLGAVWLTRRGDEVQALSTVCPHAGCAVDWQPVEHEFRCPCHASVFAPDGAVRSGPSPRPMDPLDCRVQDGRVQVTWTRFRQGVRDREPV
jgi:Rieske Fe-S protein